MTKTNLLVCAVLLSLLSISFAVPYGDPRKIDELKIPFCLDQVGHKCKVCGYNADAQTNTAPNVINTACLPSQSGCTAFADMKGEVCDKTKACSCGFNRDFWGKCIPKVIDNCMSLDITGTECETCIDKSSGIFGGGLTDYGLSFDRKQCIDNIANGTPNCWGYIIGDTVCGKCMTGYYLNSLNKCIKATVSNIPSDCEVVNDAGDRCLRCQYYQTLKRDTAVSTTIQDQCSASLIPSDNDQFCLEWTIAPNGIEKNLNNCVLCAAGYALRWSTAEQKAKCIQIIDDNGIPHTYYLDNDSTSGINDSTKAIYEWCIAYTDIPKGDGTNLRVCSIPRTTANVALYSVAKTSTKIVDTTNFCNDWDAATATCKTQNDCRAGSVYEKTWKICSSQIYTCLPSCKVSDGGAFCDVCHDGYVAENGRCRMISTSTGCQEENPDMTCKTCFFNFIAEGGAVKSYKLKDNGTGDCEEVVIDWCATFGETNLCTACAAGYTLQKNKCKPNAPATPQPMTYGCLEGDKTKCTKPLPGFYCGTDGIKCWKANCATYDDKGECLTCRLYQQVRAWDSTTNQFDCKIITSFMVGSSASNEFLDGQECKETIDGCTCSACKDGLPSISDHKCYRWANTPSGYKATIPGCLKHSSDLACDVCEEGALKSADNKCYRLYKRSRSVFYTATNSDGAYSEVPELCKTASTADACTECDTNYDVGLVSIAAGKGDAANPAYGFCVYNKQTDKKRSAGNYLGNAAVSWGVSNNADVNLNIPGCKTYKADTIPGSLCTAALTGWSLTGTEANTLDNSSLADGTPAIADSTQRCKKGKVAAGKCTECDSGQYLKNDICNANHAGCLKMDITTEKCTTPLPQYALDSTSNAPTVSLQNAYEAAASSCTEPTAFRCAIRKYKYYKPDTTFLWEISECGKGTEFKNKRCVATTTIIPNCASFSLQTGNCQKCNAGFTLSYGNGASNARGNIPTTQCITSITNCLTYDSNGQCLTCNNMDGVNRVTDVRGNVCLNPKDAISGCLYYAFNDPTKCLKCVTGRGLPEDGCKNKDPNCWATNSVTGFCTTCSSNYLPNYKGVCVPQIQLTNCATAYNSTQCFQCSANFVKLRNKDNAESEFIGVCVSSHIPDCMFANEQNTECLRCNDNYANLGGYCVQTDTVNFPSQCAQLKYDTDKKRLFCSECNRGYAIDKNYTTCVNNNHACADISGGNDCAKLQSLVGYEVKAKCDDYGRSSSTLIAFSALIASIIFLLF